jgi:perosamine synthetase
LLLSGVRPGDLVIVPNITFVASLNCITYTGAEPLLADIHADTWQMDLNLLEEYLDKNATVRDNACYHNETGRRISCIMPVHVLGNMCDMNAVSALAERFHLAVVEDATEALGSHYSGRHAGTLARFGCLSFNGNKIITTGGGGMILTDDEAMAKKAKHITTQAKSDPFEYIHDETGYNYRLVNVLAAMGVAQLEQLPAFLKRKKEVAALYIDGLKHLPGIRFQKVYPEVIANNWLFTILADRQHTLIAALVASGIQVRPLWVPMNRLPMFSNCIYVQQKNISEEVYRASISLPCSSSITNEEVQKVIDVICKN